MRYAIQTQKNRKETLQSNTRQPLLTLCHLALTSGNPRNRKGDFNLIFPVELKGF